MNQTLYKNLLICYHYGSRGDFLASILAGDKLKQCYKSYWISHPNATYIKIHNPNPAHTYFAIGNISLDGFVFDESVRTNFKTVKISIDCYDSKFKCALLKLSKDQQLTPTNILHYIHQCDVYNNDVKLYDHLFDYKVSYNSLCDIEYLADLYYNFTSSRLTNEDRVRIEHNILINQKLIKDAKQQIGKIEVNKIYDHFFNGIAYN